MRGVICFLIAAAASIQSASAGQIWLTMDRVHPYTVEQDVDSIVIGNPAIADVTVRDGNNLLMFGKAPGLTNIYFFDAQGEVIDNLVVRVRTPSTDMLTVHRGAARTTYNCTTNCEATVTVGDDQTAFNGVSQQIGAKYGQAQGAANSNSGTE